MKLDNHISLLVLIKHSQKSAHMYLWVAPETATLCSMEYVECVSNFWPHGECSLASIYIGVASVCEEISNLN